MSAQKPSAKEFAAVVYALAVARGRLYSVQSGDIDKEDISRILKGTASATIADAIGLRESDIAVDWSEHLSEKEQRAIQGEDT